MATAFQEDAFQADVLAFQIGTEIITVIRVPSGREQVGFWSIRNHGPVGVRGPGEITPRNPFRPKVPRGGNIG